MQYAGGDVPILADEVEEADPSQVLEAREEAEGAREEEEGHGDDEHVAEVQQDREES